MKESEKNILLHTRKDIMITLRHVVFLGTYEKLDYSIKLMSN